MPWVRGLDDVGAPAEVGGKGRQLARLRAAGLPVPPGFVVTTKAYRAWRAAGSGDGVPPRVAEAVRRAYRRRGAPLVAVRSSATTEDTVGASAAGQHDTVLGVQGADAVLAAVLRCWRSADSERARAYRAEHAVGDASGAEVAMAVVVQQQVAARAAGVGFSVDPLTGDDVVLLDATPGLGDALVSGEVDPTSYRVDRATGAVTLVAGPPLLNAAETNRLVGLVSSAERVLDSPVDVEWCLDDEQAWLVQARPVTASAPLDPWNDSRAGDFLWTNTNVGEAIPDVMTPATWSMVQVFLRDAMATASVRPFLGYGRIGGRVYLNVSVMAALSRSVGVGEGLFRRLTTEVFGRVPDDIAIPPVDASRWRLLRGVAPMAAHVLSEARRDHRVLGGYLTGHPERCRTRRAEIAAVEAPDALARLWSDALEPEFHRVSRMLSAATRSSGASFVTTRQRLQTLVGDRAANALTAGLGSLASLGLLEGLDRLQRGELDTAGFADRYGHRGPHEFELSEPRPGEDPAWVARELGAVATAPGAYAGRLAAQQQARDEAWAELRRRHPVQARVLGPALRRWARIAHDREWARDEVIRYFWVLRAYAVRAGEMTGLGPDVFFLDGPEILRVLQGETLPPRLAAARRTAWEGYRALPPYPALIRGRFDPFCWAADPLRRSDLYLDPAVGDAGTVGSAADGDAAVRGFPGSAGVVEGRVRVLGRPEEADALRSGEVLVTTVTNIGWTPVFARAGAVVTDVGAPLSHAAIVARELGLPCVVGCGDATMRLATGDHVRVDGSAGTVTLL